MSDKGNWGFRFESFDTVAKRWGLPKPSNAEPLLVDPCPRCAGHEAQPEHLCPYQVCVRENSPPFCQCCEECEQRCQDDV